MIKQYRRFELVSLWIAAAGAAVGCQGREADAPADDAVVTVSSAIGGVTTGQLQLQVSKNACAANVAQSYFKVTNIGSAPIPLSKVSIKYWINDVGATITPAVWYGGCVTSANGTCVHPVTAVTATATPFSPACGPAGQQANVEIAIATTDTAQLLPGQTWSNLQTAVNRVNYSNFSPGTATWFSGCGTGQPYAADPRYAVYADGDLVNNQGVTVPLCRAPAVVQVQSYIDRLYYPASDIVSSFVTAQGQQIDCIPFAAQRSVKAWLAAGVAMPTSFPTAPPTPPAMPPPNGASDLAFAGQPDVNGQPQSCGAGLVPVMRPTIAEIQAAGGIAAFEASKRARRLAGHQDTTQHDCWLNTAPGDGTAAGAMDWEHAAGVQTSGFLPAGANGFFGLHTITPIYTPHFQAQDEHTDSQFWAQTGGCDNWFNSTADLTSGDESRNQCQTGAACTSCTGDACKACAVQSLEVAALVSDQGKNNLELFFTTDGYFVRNCFAGSANCLGCPTTSTVISQPGSDVAVTENTDCFVAMGGAKFTPHMALTPAGGTGAGQYGIAPNEMEFTIMNGSAIGKPGWWVFVNKELIGWYPPQTFNWPDGSAGPMNNGPATYLQAGGEVFNMWPGGFHTDTAMVSDNAAQSGFKFAAYNRNVGYFDSTVSSMHDATLSYVVTPPEEGDKGIAGLCGLTAAGWTDASGAQGAYSLAKGPSTPPGASDWGTYLYFGGGLLSQQTTPPPLIVTAGAVTSALASYGPNVCLSLNNFTPNGLVDIEYIGVPVPGMMTQVTSAYTPKVGADGKLKFDDDTFKNISNLACTNSQLLSSVKVVVIDIATNRNTTFNLSGGLWCGNSSVPAQSGDVSGCGL